MTKRTGIKVVIVGAGFGGLSAAIECRRQGHDVAIYESFPELKQLGDIITFGSNAGRIFARWGDGLVTQRFRPLCLDTLAGVAPGAPARGNYIHKWDTGEVVFHQPPVPYDPQAPYFSGHRGELHEVVFKYARDDLGIPIHLGRKVEDYFENEAEAGIVLENGEKVTGDLVIASDGVRSKARTIVLGYEDKPKSSGYAIWRAWFSTEGLLADPATRPFCEHGDTFNGWIGADIHFLVSTLKNGKDISWVLTHKDAHNINESWSFPGKLSEVLETIKDWDPTLTKIISKTPEDKLVDWKLVYRDPLPTWTSPCGRTLLLGDAAHPFLPTSAQGAAQAVEDAVTIAVCLKRGGKGAVPMAVRAHEQIRYERVKRVQKMGESTRDKWHKVNWEDVKRRPESVAFPREDWVLGHDTEKHAEEMFEEAASKVQPRL